VYGTLISLGIKVPPVGIPTTLEAKGCNIQNMSRRKVIYLCLYFPELSIYVFTVITVNAAVNVYNVIVLML
jgi:hypothetical protein